MAAYVFPLLQEFKAEYAENLLPYISSYNKALTFNVATTGSASATAAISTDRAFDGISSLKIQLIDTDGEITISNTSESFTAPKDGYYNFSFRFFDTRTTPPFGVYFVLKTYRNTADYNTYSVDASNDTSLRYRFNEWNTFGERIYLDAGDVLTWTYFFDALAAEPGTTVFIDGQCVQYQDRDLGLCAMFQPIKELPLTAAVTLNFPNIVAGTTEVLNATLAGVVESDFVDVSTPFASQANGLFYSARVSAANTVTVSAENSTGSDINPASGVFNLIKRVN